MNDPQPTWVEVSRTLDRRANRHRALVLQAVGLAYGSFEADGQFVLIVRTETADRARDELARYERENAGWPPRERALVPVSQGIHAAIVYCGIMALFHSFQHAGTYGVDWSGSARADAALIRSGEWWRTITALSLHVDLPHLAGNMLFGSAFGVVLAQSIGVGLAWWGFLLTGAIGNALNAAFQDPTHRSMGASTAVFGALGIQAAYEWTRRRELGYRGFRRWIPLVMGAALLGWLGTGGASIEDVRHLDATFARVDVMAHLFGFAAGVAIGVALGRVRRPLRVTLRTQVVATSAVVVALAAAWAVAILRA